MPESTSQIGNQLAPNFVDFLYQWGGWLFVGVFLIFSIYLFIRRFYPDIDWRAAIKLQSLRQQVRWSEVNRYGIWFSLNRLVFTPDIRTALFGRLSFFIVGFFAVIIILVLGCVDWTGLFNLASDPILSDRSRGTLGTIVASVASAGIIGIIFLLERGGSEIYHGVALHDRFVEMLLFPLVYGLFAAVSLTVYYAIFVGNSVESNIALIFSSGSSLILLVLLYSRIVTIMADNSLSDYFLSQISRGAITRSIRQERHNLAAEIVESNVSDHIKYEQGYSPYLDFISGQGDVAGSQLNLDGEHISDVNLKSLKEAARMLGRRCDEEDSEVEMSISTNSGPLSTTKVIDSDLDLSDGEIQLQLSRSLTTRRKKLWGYSEDRFEESLNTLRSAVIYAAKNEQNAKFEEYLDGYEQIAVSLFDFYLPTSLKIHKSIHKGVASDIQDGFTEALNQSGTNEVTAARKLNGILLLARQRHKWREYDIYLSNLNRFIDDTYRYESSPSVREAIALRIGNQASYLAENVTNTDLSNLNRFSPLNVYIYRSRRTAVLLARKGDFESLDQFLDGYNQLSSSIDRHLDENAGGTGEQGFWDGNMPNQREIFTQNPLYPDYSDYDASELVRVFQISLDAVRFEITAAVYSAFEDENVPTPESWDELSFSSDLYSDSRTLTRGFTRWQSSLRGQGTDIGSGDVAGPAMEMVHQWNSERGESASKAYANLVLYFEERGQSKSLVDIDTPLDFDELYKITTDVVRTREESVLGVLLSWDTVEHALEPFKDQADLQQVGFLKEVPNDDVEILTQRFKEAFRTQFTLRNRLYQNGQIELSHHLTDPIEVETNWTIPKEGVRYTNNGVPGLLKRDMISDMQSEVVNSWLEGLDKRGKLETLTVSTPEAIYSRLHQQLKGAKEESPLLILNSDHLSFNNSELGLNGISWPTGRKTPVIEHLQTSKQIPVYKYDTEYDAVILPPETSIRVTEPDDLAQIPIIELKRLDLITLRKIEDAHPYESLPTETISKKWDSILVKANYQAQIHCDGPSPIAIRLTK